MKNKFKNTIQIGRLLFSLIIGIGIGHYGTLPVFLVIMGVAIGWYVSYEDISYQYKSGHKKSAYQSHD